MRRNARAKFECALAALAVHRSARDLTGRNSNPRVDLANVVESTTPVEVAYRHTNPATITGESLAFEAGREGSDPERGILRLGPWTKLFQERRRRA
jgi:hypothetical protein